MRPLLALTLYGCLQLVRARIAAFFFAGGLMVVGFSVLLEEFAAGKSGRALVYIGLAAISLVTSVLAAVLPVVIVRGELDNRHAHILLTRPIPRSLFVIARFLSTSIVVAAAALLFSVILGALSVVYGGEPFGTVVVAGLFGCLGAILLAAVSTLASVATSAVTAIVIVGLFFVLGRLTPELAALALRGGARGPLFELLSRALPDLGRFQWFDVVAAGDSPGAAVLYFLTYVAFLITIASVLMREKDLT